MGKRYFYKLGTIIWNGRIKQIRVPTRAYFPESSNKKSLKYYEVHGYSFTIKGWSEFLKINRDKLYNLRRDKGEDELVAYLTEVKTRRDIDGS